MMNPLKWLERRRKAKAEREARIIFNAIYLRIHLNSPVPPWM